MWTILTPLPAEYDSRFVRIVRFDTPLAIGINGRKGQGVVVRPDAGVQNDMTN